MVHDFLESFRPSSQVSLVEARPFPFLLEPLCLLFTTRLFLSNFAQKLKASYTSSLRPHTLVAEGLIH